MSTNRACKRIVAAWALALALFAPASAFLIQTSDGPLGPVQQSWRRVELGIAFVVHSTGSDDLGNDETHRIIRESFQVWEEVPTSSIHFVDQGLTDALRPRR